MTISYTDYSRAKGQRSYNALNIVFDLDGQPDAGGRVIIKVLLLVALGGAALVLLLRGRSDGAEPLLVRRAVMLAVIVLGAVAVLVPDYAHGTWPRRSAASGAVRTCSSTCSASPSCS